MFGTQDLYFVYLGGALPSYVCASIQLAKQYSGLNVHLLGHAEYATKLGRNSDTLIPVEDFYDPVPFQTASENVVSPHRFRAGFFLKSLERFFVLEQFMEKSGVSEFLHAELDQVLFRVDLLAAHLAEIGRKGIYFPFHSDRFALASIFYCNDAESLRSLIDLARFGPRFNFEMEVLASWARSHSLKSNELPTLATAYGVPTGDIGRAGYVLNLEESGGAVDAAQIGQWVAGIDPRNVPLKKYPTTKFVDPPNRELLTRKQLESTIFKLDRTDGSLLFSYQGQPPQRLYNLHLHSKVHAVLLRKPAPMEYILELANSSEAQRIPGTRLMQLREQIPNQFARLKRPIQGITKRGRNE